PFGESARVIDGHHRWLGPTSVEAGRDRRPGQTDAYADAKANCAARQSACGTVVKQRRTGSILRLCPDDDSPANDNPTSAVIRGVLSIRQDHVVVASRIDAVEAIHCSRQLKYVLITTGHRVCGRAQVCPCARVWSRIT